MAAAKAVDDWGASDAAVPGVACAILWVVMASIVQAVLDGEVARTFILHPSPMTWENASHTCREANGTLATIDQSYVIPDMLYEEGWVLWVGLKVNSSSPTWEDGTGLNWTNWYVPAGWTEGGEPICTAAITSQQDRFVWLPRSCQEELPFLCEVPQGSCRFTVTYYATLISFNNEILLSVDRPQCLERCQNERHYDCRSLDVNRQFNTCQLSSETRWTQPQAFYRAEKSWDYYHWTCITGTFSNDIYVSPNGVELPSTPEVTTAVTTAHASTVVTTVQSSTVTEDPGEIVCVKVKPPTENETEEIQREVQELQNITRDIKEQSRQRKKTSRVDKRTSATAVGTLAVGLVSLIFLLIVLSDIISAPQHIRHMNRKGAPWGRLYRRVKRHRKRRQQEKNAMKFTEYSETHTTIGSNGALVVNAPLPHNHQPQGLLPDDHVDHVYSRGSPNRPGNLQVSRKLGLHLERIQQLEQEFGGLRGSRMAVSCPNLDKVDEATLGSSGGQSSGGVVGRGSDGPQFCGGNVGMNSAGKPRIRVMRIDSKEALKQRVELENTTGHHAEDGNAIEEHAAGEGGTEEQADREVSLEDHTGYVSSMQNHTDHGHAVEDHADDGGCQYYAIKVRPHIPYDSESETGCSNLTHPLQFEARADGNRHTHNISCLQNIPFPVLNTSDFIEMSEFRNMLHRQSTAIEGHGHSGSENLNVQGETDLKNAVLVVEEANSEGQCFDASVTSPEQRPEVKICIEEDDSPMHGQQPYPVQVDTKLLRVQESAYFPSGFKQRFRTKQSKQTLSTQTKKAK